MSPPSQWEEMQWEAYRRPVNPQATRPQPIIPKGALCDQGLIGWKRYDALIDNFTVMQAYARPEDTECPVTVYENRLACIVTRSLFDELNSNEPEGAIKQIQVAIDQHFRKGSQRLSRECFE